MRPEAEEAQPPIPIIDPEYWRQMRAIMYQPTAVWLARTGNGDRWLTDQFVLLKINESLEFSDLLDGGYKLTVSKGPEEREVASWPYLDGYFNSLKTRVWHPASPTGWSVAEDSVNKAMLWTAEGEPCLVGEPTWTAIKRYHPNCWVEHSFRGNSIFRFSELPQDCPGCMGEADDVYCGHTCTPFAYAAGVRIPDDQELPAKALAEAMI